MGTNYYYKTNICKWCGRFDTIHIGKSSVGWTFSFHGTDEIRSYQDWLKVIESGNGVIEDEYGRAVGLDWFKDLVERKKSEKYNSTVEARKDYRIRSDTDWLDEEGNSFTNSDFS